ncbi:MAG: hypothetical protein GY938_04915 [Ketobacter sp.]|nr:hypothetical protein [Ketobacter sp.]
MENLDSRHYKNENAHFNRAQIRCLLNLRSGHNQYKYYQYHCFNKGRNDICNLCHTGKSQTASHFLFECTNAIILQKSKDITEFIEQIHYDAFEKMATGTTDEKALFVRDKQREYDPFEFVNYVFPALSIECQPERNMILWNVIQFYRQISTLILFT